MQTIKFKYEQTGISLWWGVIIVVFTVVLLTKINLTVNKSLAYFLLTGSYFISNFIISKKITKGIKELNFDDNSIKITYFNTFKETVTVQLKDVKFNQTNKLISICTQNNKTIGVAYKELLLEPGDWDNFLHEIT